MLHKEKSFDFDNFIVEYELMGNEVLMLESMLLLLTRPNTSNYDKHFKKMLKYAFNAYAQHTNDSFKMEVRIEIGELDADDMQDFLRDCQEYVIGQTIAEELNVNTTVKGFKVEEL